MKTRHPAGFTPTSPVPQLLLGLAAMCALFLAGCNSGYNMKVDAISRPAKKPTATAGGAPVAEAPPPVSYKIRSTNPENSEDTLRYKEAAKFVKTALSGKGMYEAGEGEKADMIVEIDYGMGPPKAHMETMSEPIYLTLPGPVTYERVQVGTDRNGNPIYSVVAVQGPPVNQYMGEREYQILVVTYEKYLRLTARENQPAAEGRPAPEIWTIDVTSEGESKNLRKYLPALAAASIDYIGKDTRGQKDVRLKDEKDGAVAFVKKGM